MQSPDESQLWWPGPSLWSLISDIVPGSELSKIHATLGHFLVETYTEVHAEAEMWHKIWQKSQRGGNHGSRAGTPLPHQQVSILADPPVVKELLRAEVKLLLQTLRERASRGGRDGEELLFQYKPETVNYVLGHLDSCYSNCTNSGDTDPGSRPSSHCSVRSSAEDEIEAVRDKLNVSDIDQVVDRLKCILTDESEVLRKLVRHFKRNIKQNSRSHSESGKPEPTLTDLRALRGAIQTDLELYPSSLAASPPASSPLPVTEMKNRFRLSAGENDSDETQPALNSASVLRPHPPPPSPSPVCCPKPRPPAGPPPTKTSAPIKSLLSHTSGQRRSTLSSHKSRKTTICNRISASTHVSSHHSDDQIMVQSEYDCSISPGQDSADHHCMPLTPSPSFQIKTQRDSPVREAHLSPHRNTHCLSKEYDLSPQWERKNSSVWRSRNINITPSNVPALGLLSDADSYSNSNADCFGSTTGNLETQNGEKKSTCREDFVSVTMQTDNDRGKSIAESFHSSVMLETGSPVAKRSDRRSNSQTDGNKDVHLWNDVNRQQSHSSHCSSSYHSESSGEQGQVKCIQPAPMRLNVQFFTSSKIPSGGNTNQTKSGQETQTDPELINKFFQPAPPARVST